MINNIKTEIIYYDIPTDFEFEFNLCNCCQMRLLTEQVNDKSNLFKALQRSFARSRIIIIIGDINNENNIIKMVSNAIGKKSTLIDNELYNLDANFNYEIPQNSVPLITENGLLGGCILESGPQSMIFLTKDKSVRKELMNSLVNQYITDLSRFPIAGAANPEPEIIQNDQETDISAKESEPIEEPKVIEEAEPVVIPENAEPTENEEPQELPQEEFQFEDIESGISNTEEYDEYLDYNTTNDIFSPQTAKPDYMSFDEYDEFDEDNESYYDLTPQGNNNTLKIITLIISIVLLILLAFIAYGFIYEPLKNGTTIAQNFKNIFRLFNLY